MEPRYSAQWTPVMLADYYWTSMREDHLAERKRKNKKILIVRTFLCKVSHLKVFVLKTVFNKVMKSYKT